MLFWEDDKRNLFYFICFVLFPRFFFLFLSLFPSSLIYIYIFSAFMRKLVGLFHGEKGHQKRHCFSSPSLSLAAAAVFKRRQRGEETALESAYNSPCVCVCVPRWDNHLRREDDREKEKEKDRRYRCHAGTVVVVFSVHIYIGLSLFSYGVVGVCGHVQVARWSMMAKRAGA